MKRGIALLAMLTCFPAFAASKPVLLYLDVVAGPNAGGEKNLGGYLSLFGQHLNGSKVRVLIGDDEAARVLYTGRSRGLADVQQITVQVGPLPKATPGKPLPVRVVVDGVESNSNLTFTVQPGDVLFVDNARGNDATAKRNDPDRPWRTVQTQDGKSGALDTAKPGDTLVLRGGRLWNDRGRNDRWFRFRYATGSKPTGAKGTGYLTIMAYPGEAVRFRPARDSYGGIHGIDSRNYPGYSQWIAISGLIIEGGDASVRDAPINLQVDSNHWRIVNNELGPWTAGTDARSAGISGNGANVQILGNHIHDIGGGTLNHCLYLDTGAADVEIAYNHMHHCLGGNIVQTYDNLHEKDLRAIRIHHNLLHDGNRYGLNIGEGTESAEVFNNIVYNTALPALRLNVDARANSKFLITHNTFAVARDEKGKAEAIVNDGSTSIRATIENNRILPRNASHAGVLSPLESTAPQP